MNLYVYKVKKYKEKNKFDIKTQSDSHEFLVDLIHSLKEESNAEMMKEFFDVTVEESCSCCYYNPLKKNL